MISSEEQRVNILGVGVSPLSIGQRIQKSEDLLDTGGSGMFANWAVHGIMEAQSDEEFRKILNNSFLTTLTECRLCGLDILKGLRA